MTIIKHFIKVWEYNPNDYIQYNSLDISIPNIWLAILTNDGSLTRNLSIIEASSIHINLIEEKSTSFLKSNTVNTITSRYRQQKYIGRKVWLIKDKIKVVFAQSSLHEQDSIISSFSTNIPIGKTLINSEQNIHRKLKSIYLGYSTCLENHFQSYGPLWGRTYQILFDKKATIMIDEIFAPNNIKSIPSINLNINVQSFHQ